MRIDEQTLVAAAFFFERENGILLGEFEKMEIVSAGLDALPPRAVEDEIVRFVAENKVEKNSLLVSAIFALGKRGRPELKALFVDVLRSTFRSYPEVTYQAIIGLENLGETIFNGSSSIKDIEINSKIAQRYLEPIEA